MPYEKGGRADKAGNTYEKRWVIYQMLKVINEELYSVELEAIGEDEKGMDLWVTYPDGSREGQQCKGRNGSKAEWDISSLKSRNIIKNWKKQLDRCNSNMVSLVSPLSCPNLIDLIDRARNTNNNPNDFLEYQIKNSNEEFIKFFNSYCSELNLNPEVDKDLCKIINYLSRTIYNAFPDSSLKDIIYEKINCLFIGDKNDIYRCFEDLILEGNILGKPVTNSYLLEYLKKNKIQFRNLSLDTRIAPRIEELNNEYKETFIPINEKLINRNEFKTCIDNIKDGKSIVIDGKAGIGKSGCAQAVILFCEDNRISHLAIKLDKKIPHGSAEAWGKDLGLPTSIVYSLHSISINENAVIILDQLDALRWTKAHSRDALIICSEIIRQVMNLNLERKKKISVVLVCRTYDLENDPNIKSLFINTNKEKKSVDWVRISVKEFDEDIVKNVIGEGYTKLSKKLKQVLKIPSNLYIWQHLDRKKTYDEFSTADQLIFEWWKQILDRCEENEVDQVNVKKTKTDIINKIDKYGMSYINCMQLDDSDTTTSLKYLTSNGIIMVINNMVSFAHQSILDYFSVEKMLRNYFDGESIINIIGPKEMQTPEKRYQVQMLLQNIEEYDICKFIDAGKQMLESSNVRFYVKYVFLEVLGQCTSIDSDIKKFILEYCQKEEFVNHIIDDVINGHPIFVQLLLENGIMDKWMQDNKKRDIAINLMVSICPQYYNDDLKFIKKYAFISKECDQNLFRCFSNKIQDDTDDMFELRMEFYKHYPEMICYYIDFKKMFKKCDLRAVRIIEFLLNHKIKNNGRSIYRNEEELLDENSEIMISNSNEVIDRLLPYIPQEKEYYKIYRNWDGRDFYSRGLERTCVVIIKKANTALINKNPEDFIERYKEFMGKGYIIYNEIILSGLEKLPAAFSNYVVNYIAANLNENIFDKTSGNEDELDLVKAVLRKHTIYCSDDTFLLLENKIIHYIDPKAKKWYEDRINYNKQNKNGNTVYWSFWGDMQLALLSCLPTNRMSLQAKELLKVLNRRFENIKSRYIHSIGHSGCVKSPISGKKLNNKQWLQILTNKKVNKKGHSAWIEVKGGFIESSIEEFSSDFLNVVSAEPERFINLVLNCHRDIAENYIDSLFNGVAFSKKLNDVSTNLLEKMILKYRYNYKSYRAEYICYIIKEKENANWSQDIIDILNDIAINHSNPNNDKPIVTSNKDNDMKSFDMLQSNAINCVRGNAAIAIGQLAMEQ